MTTSEKVLKIVNKLEEQLEEESDESKEAAIPLLMEAYELLVASEEGDDSSD